MNFRAPRRSEPEAMLRRLLLAVLVVASSAAFVLPASAQGAMDCEQVSLQSPAEGCGDEAMAAGGGCALACHAGACITPSLDPTQLDVQIAPPLASGAVLDSDGARAPDTAPPKHFVS